MRAVWSVESCILTHKPLDRMAEMLAENAIRLNVGCG